MYIKKNLQYVKEKVQSFTRIFLNKKTGTNKILILKAKFKNILDKFNQFYLRTR